MEERNLGLDNHGTGMTSTALRFQLCLGLGRLTWAQPDGGLSSLFQTLFFCCP